MISCKVISPSDVDTFTFQIGPHEMIKPVQEPGGKFILQSELLEKIPPSKLAKWAAFTEETR